MEETEIEDLLAGLESIETLEHTNPESTVCGQSEEVCNVEGQINTTFLALGRIYGRRLPVDGERYLLPEQYLSCIEVLQNKILETDTIAQITEMLGRETAVLVSIRLAQKTNTEADDILSTEEWEKTQELAQELRRLLEVKKNALRTLEENVSTKCPNLAALLDLRTSAELFWRELGTDKVELARIAVLQPANLVNPQTSPLTEDSLITSVPLRFKRQCLRILAGKVVLAARLDNHANPATFTGTGSNLQGTQWRNEVEKRIDRLLAPPLSVQYRALPKPIGYHAKSRGGQRVRKQKLKRAPTKLQQEQNIIKFGEN